ncbi:MAG TPA: hypothetical protein VJK53_01390 [Candidatus Paceibacterota bacterium]
MEKLSIEQIEKEVASWKPAARRQLLSHLVNRYKQDFHSGTMNDEVIEGLGWTVLAQSSIAFWDNPEDAIYDRV